MGAKRVLPEKDNPAAQKLSEYYATCPLAEVDRLAKEYGYANRASFESNMFVQLGARRIRKGPEVKLDGGTVPPEPDPAITLPPVALKHYASSKRAKGDPEDQVILLGDHHDGEITPTYNPEVCAARTDKLFHSAMVITELHRHMYSVDNLVIIMVGDMVHGENPRQGARIGTTACGALSQVYELALPRLNNLICSFKENFKTVKIYGVPGNHGMVSRDAPETSNWDIALYKALARERLPAGIEVYPPRDGDFQQIVNINGFDFFCYHGSEIRMSNGVPYFAQTRKVMSWYVTFDRFPYAVQGHFHKDDYLRISARTKLFCNGALVSDDPYALRVVGTSTIPTQCTFGVHARHGVTWNYNLIVDDKYLPDRKEPITPTPGG